MRRTRIWRLGLAALIAGLAVAAPVAVTHAATASTSWVYCDYPYQYLKYGCKGSDVARVQKLLNCVGEKVKVDGYFGSNTRYAVMVFQKRVGLKIDGILGPNTWNALHMYC